MGNTPKIQGIRFADRVLLGAGTPLTVVRFAGRLNVRTTKRGLRFAGHRWPMFQVELDSRWRRCTLKSGVCHLILFCSTAERIEQSLMMPVLIIPPWQSYRDDPNPQSA